MIEVNQHRSLEALRSLRDELDRLNRASQRRCPFTTFALLQNVVQNDEVFRRAGAPKPLFLTAHENGRLLGLLPLRATTERIGRVPYTKLEWLLTLEVDRPHLVARPEDERAVARAMWRYLARDVRWSMLELQQQDADSAMTAAMEATDAPRFYVRELASREGNVLQLKDAHGAPRFPDAAGYIQALSRKQRSNVKRSVLDTLARPGMTMLSSARGDVAPLLFDLYLDVERRSWKARSDAAVSRSTERIAYYRALFAADAPMKLCVDVLLEDGVPVAGHVTGTYEGAMYFLQTVYDERLDDVSPGTLMLLWSLKQAVGDGVLAFNMLPDFSYYKSRWLADVVPTKTLQVFRTGSLPWAKAMAGEVKRRVDARRGKTPTTSAALQNASKLEADRRADAPPPPPADRDLAARVLLEVDRLGVKPVTAAEQLKALPFDGAVRAKAKVA